MAKVLRKQGLQGLGINAIARAAGRDKLLIYKYFGSLEGLCAAFAASQRLFPTVEEMLGPARERLDSLSSLEIARIAASGYLREIRLRPLTLEILRWELVLSNPLTPALSETRTAATREFNLLFGKRPDLDIPALTSILYGGLVYMLLKAGAGPAFNGMDLGAEKTWKRVEQAMHRLLEAILGE